MLSFCNHVFFNILIRDTEGAWIPKLTQQATYWRGKEDEEEKGLSLVGLIIINTESKDYKNKRGSLTFFWSSIL